MLTNLPSVPDRSQNFRLSHPRHLVVALAAWLLLASSFDTSAAEVVLSWQDNSTNETGFKLERATAAEAFTPIATIAANATSYTDTTVAASITYNYRVFAYNSAGSSAYSNVAVATISPASSGTAPTISDLPNRTIAEDSDTGAIAFTVGDLENAAGSLTVSGSSSSPTLVPDGAINFGGSGASRTVTITPAANQSGTATITITVSDGTTTASDTMTLTVSAVNGAPTISAVANQTLSPGVATISLAFTVGDEETAASDLTVTGTSSNTTLVPNASMVFGGSGASRTVTITPATAQSGTATITLNVSDGALQTTDTFTLSVTAVASANTAPTISNVANQAGNEDAPTGVLVFTVGDVETAASSLTVSGTSSNPTLVPNAAIAIGGSGASRTVTVMPAVNQNGVATITLTVSDGTLMASDAFAFTVAAVNDVPTVSNITSRTINEDATTGAVAFTIGDVETAGGSLTVSGSSSNPTLVPNAAIVFGGSAATRTVTVTPAANQNGTATVTVTVSDGTAATSSAFLVTVTAVNDTPTITDLTDRTISQDANTGAIAFAVGDAETAAASLTVSGTSSNTTLVPNAAIVFGGSGTNRTVTVTPAAGRAGTATITITVSDGVATRTDLFALNVSPVASANQPPTITSIPDQAGSANGSIGPVVFTIADDETAAAGLTISATSSNTSVVPLSGITLSGSGATRLATVTPAAGQAGSATITITVSDGTTSRSATFVVTIAAAPPTEARMLNLSTRVYCRTGQEALIPGFVIGGTASKRVLLRAVGPTLATALFNVPDALPDPRMVLKRWNGTDFVDVASNNNWSTNANASEIRLVSAEFFAFAIPDNSLDAVLLLDLAPGRYTVVVEDASGGDGVVILEFYDTDTAPNGSRFVNLSNRGYVGTGTEAMISGFVVSDEGPKSLLVRAVGPGLAVAPHNISNSISDPLIEVYRRNSDGSDTLMLTHDNWGEGGDAALIAGVAADVFAFPLPSGSMDAAFVATFAPGVYTAIVRGANGATGTALVEVYTVE